MDFLEDLSCFGRHGVFRISSLFFISFGTLVAVVLVTSTFIGRAFDGSFAHGAASFSFFYLPRTRVIETFRRILGLVDYYLESELHPRSLLPPDGISCRIINED